MATTSRSLTSSSRASASLIRSALESLAPGGIAVFQVPTYKLGYRFVAAEHVDRERPDEPDMEMHCLPQRHVLRIAAETGCRVLEVREHDLTDAHGSDLFTIQAGAAAEGPGS